VGRARRCVHLTILALPVFTTLPGDRSLHLGDRLWLRCAAQGSPTPRIGWTLNDQPVTGLDLLGTGGTGPRTPRGRGGRQVQRPNHVGRKWLVVNPVGSGSTDWSYAGRQSRPLSDEPPVRAGKKSLAQKTAQRPQAKRGDLF
jgi:hypothetical protein